MTTTHVMSKRFSAARVARAARRLLAAASLAVLAASCAPAPALLVTPTTQPDAATQQDAADCPADRMTIKDLRWFRDSQDAWRVVGTIENRWDRPVSKLVTEVEALDASGNVIDHGEDISVYPLNLKPGAQAPYTAWVKREFAGVQTFRVEADECVLAEQQERSEVALSKDRLSTDGAGRAQVTGDLANPGGKTVLVNGLTAVVLDDRGAPLAVEGATVTPRYLAPGEHGPFRVTLDLPPGGAHLAKGYKLYMDVVIAEAQPEIINVARDVRLAAPYVDGAGHLRVAGEVTNPESESVTLRLQAALYDSAAKKTLIDAANLDIDTPLAPGETRQFELQDWGSAGERAAGVTIASHNRPAVIVRVEPFNSWTGAPQASR